MDFASIFAWRHVCVCGQVYPCIWMIHCAPQTAAAEHWKANLCPSLHSPIWPSEPLPVLCVELHEPQVVLSARPVISSLPQRVFWYQHPQWLLSVFRYPVVTAQTLESTNCAIFPAGVLKPRYNGGLFQGNRGRSWNICVVGDWPASWLLPLWHLTSRFFLYHVRRVCFWIHSQIQHYFLWFYSFTSFSPCLVIHLHISLMTR